MVLDTAQRALHELETAAQHDAPAAPNLAALLNGNLPATPHELKKAIQHWKLSEAADPQAPPVELRSPIRERFRSLVAMPSPARVTLTAKRWHATVADASRASEPTAAASLAETVAAAVARGPEHASMDDQAAASTADRLRWALVARAALGLLDWWLHSLLDLSFQASRARDFWRRQQRRPVRHYLWRGPAHWRARGLLGHGAWSLGVPTPASALARLQALQLEHARHIGRLRLQLSELARACAGSREGLPQACLRALAEVQGTVAVYESSPRTPDKKSASAPPKSTAARLAAAAENGGSQLYRALATLEEAVAQCEPGHVAARARLEVAPLPSHVGRHWLAYCTLGVGVGACVCLSIRWHEELATLVRNSLRGAFEATADFWKVHVYAPVSSMVRELVYRDYINHSDPRAIEDADVLLHRLLVQFRETWRAELDEVGLVYDDGLAGGGGAGASESAPNESDDGGGLVATGGEVASEVLNQASEALASAASQATEMLGLDEAAAPPTTTNDTGGGDAAQLVELRESAVEPPQLDITNGPDGTGSGALVATATANLDDEFIAPSVKKSDLLSAMSRLLEQQMASPAYNMARGALLQLLLIQTQYMRCEILEQMSAMDALLRQNYMTASMSALLPAAVGTTIVVTALRRIVSRLRSRRRSRVSLVKLLRSVLLDTERLLMHARARGAKHLSELDLGLLVITLHALRRAIHRHRVLLASGERESLLVDLADMESDGFDVSEKLEIVKRVYRSQPALLGATSATGALRPVELGSVQHLAHHARSD